VPFSIQSISLRDSASIGMSFLIFISEDEVIIPKKITNRYFEFCQKSYKQQKKNLTKRSLPKAGTDLSLKYFSGNRPLI
jgi:hypothetical protein